MAQTAGGWVGFVRGTWGTNRVIVGSSLTCSRTRSDRGAATDPARSDDAALGGERAGRVAFVHRRVGLGDQCSGIRREHGVEVGGSTAVHRSSLPAAPSPRRGCSWASGRRGAPGRWGSTQPRSSSSEPVRPASSSGTCSSARASRSSSSNAIPRRSCGRSRRRGPSSTARSSCSRRRASPPTSSTSASRTTAASSGPRSSGSSSTTARSPAAGRTTSTPSTSWWPVCASPWWPPGPTCASVPPWSASRSATTRSGSRWSTSPENRRASTATSWWAVTASAAWWPRPWATWRRSSRPCPCAGWR